MILKDHTHARLTVAVDVLVHAAQDGDKDRAVLHQLSNTNSLLVCYTLTD